MGVKDGFSPGTSFEENGNMKTRGASISSAEGDGVPGS